MLIIESDSLNDSNIIGGNSTYSKAESSITSTKALNDTCLDELVDSSFMVIADCCLCMKPSKVSSL